MSKFRILDPVRVTNPDNPRFDQVLTVYAVLANGRVWAQVMGGVELFPFDERHLTLADREREAAL